MNQKYLFPNYCKAIGWVLTLPSVILGILYLYFSYEIPNFEIQFKNTYTIFDGGSTNNLTDELISLCLVIGLNLVAFSKRKVEDEWVSLMRLESLQWGIYLNSIILILAIIFVYGMPFFEIMVYNMFTPLIIFIIRFEYLMWKAPKTEKIPL
jgi:hypothetical protein